MKEARTESFYLRNIKPQLKRRFKQACKEQGRTMHQVVSEFMEMEVRRHRRIYENRRHTKKR